MEKLDHGNNRFCIDTSSIIHTWNRDYPPDVFKSVWEALDILIEEERLFAPHDVLIELDRGGDDIYEWAKAHSSMFILPDTSVQEIVRDIVNKYPSFIPPGSKDGIWADPYVVAIASAYSATVITGETPAGPGAKQPKIPNICVDYQIPYSNLLGMLRSCGFSF